MTTKKTKKKKELKDLDPKQLAFFQHYLDPKSETWSNAKQSALKAGYSLEYSENITHLMPDWLSDNIGDTKLVLKALRNVDMLLDSDDQKVQADMTKFTLKGLAKDKFSERSEVKEESVVHHKIEKITIK